MNELRMHSRTSLFQERRILQIGEGLNLYALSTVGEELERGLRGYSACCEVMRAIVSDDPKPRVIACAHNLSTGEGQQVPGAL